MARELCRAANVERTVHHMKRHRDRETKGCEVLKKQICSLCVPVFVFLCVPIPTSYEASSGPGKRGV